ncbi:MAG: nuclear transport factor 2 family protein [Bacteroidetes bacterium]|nr:nuclear transport factor 2 family protein [Bacteroidota bacterium]
MTTSFNTKQFCDSWLAAWTGNQPEQLLKFYTNDAFYLDPAMKQGLKGHEQLRAYFSKLLKYNPTLKWEAVEVMDTAKGFTMKWKATIPVGDKSITEYGLDIVELTEGKISRNEVYFDRVEWMKAMQA